MARRSLSRLAPFFCFPLVLAAILPGCGDDDYEPPTSVEGDDDAGTPLPPPVGDGGVLPDAPADPCVTLTLGDTTIDFVSIARTGLQAPVSPGVPGQPRNRITLELYEDDGTGELPPVTTGTFELGVAPDDNYGTCQHCVLLVASDLSGAPKRAFYSKSGSMTVDLLDDDTTVVVGSAKDLVLREVGQREDGTWFDLPGDACFRVPDWSFDTRPVDGGPCESAEQCPNEASQICEPLTGTCGRPQCSLTGDPPYCADDEVCLSQLVELGQAPAGPAVGACYETCDPEANAPCGAGAVCRAVGPTQSFGICQKLGAGAAGSACTPRDNVTGCVAGYVCQGDPGTCARSCDFLTATSGCNAGRYCGLSNACQAPELADPAAVGGVCASSSPELVECGIEGDAFRGLCVGLYPEAGQTACERVCRTAAPACPAGQDCLGIFSNPEIGLCHPTPVCGDGATDVLGGELCDDGNAQGGDGCSADCRTADLGVLCTGATTLAPGVSVSGTTAGGVQGFTSSCDPYAATPSALYAITAPSEGRLHVTLSGTPDLGISLYSACAADTAELRCRSVPGDDVLDLDVDAGPLLVMVRGSWPGATGSFVLGTTFTPAVCGDGQTVGREVCDDGNTEGGDGCSADCRTADYGVLCAALPTLTLGTTTGTTVGGTAVFDTTGICAYVNGGGTQRAYRFTAPTAGTLSLSLSQPTADFVLAVHRDCAHPAEDSYVACSNFASPGTSEEVGPQLEAGEVVTVIVQGFTANDAGDFTLTAAFAP